MSKEMKIEKLEGGFIVTGGSRSSAVRDRYGVQRAVPIVIADGDEKKLLVEVLLRLVDDIDLIQQVMDALTEPSEAERPRLKRVKEEATGGLLTDGGYHKQWYLERILQIALDEPVEEYRARLLAEDYAWEEGIAP